MSHYKPNHLPHGCLREIVAGVPNATALSDCFRTRWPRKKQNRKVRYIVEAMVRDGLVRRRPQLELTDLGWNVLRRLDRGEFVDAYPRLEDEPAPTVRIFARAA